MNLESILRDMCLIPALSGHEEGMMRHMRDVFSPLADQVRVDHFGNVIAAFEGTQPGAPRIMIFAHMDQLGFVIRKIDPDGLIRIERLGGIPEKVLPGLCVMVQTENGRSLPGVIGMKAHHATPAEEKYVVPPYSQLHVDIGASSATEVRGLGIEIGCPIVYEPRFTTLAGGRITATSIDDRGGCAVLAVLAQMFKEQRPSATVYLVGTVQEEFNLRGAMLAATALNPDMAISLDVMIAGDTPDLRDKLEIKLGGGPILGTYSFHGRGTLNGTIPHPALARLVREAAAREGLPLQRNAMVGLLSDSAYVQLVGKGIPSVDLGFPARYTHTPIESCQLSDLEALSNLTAAVVRAVDSGLSFARL